MLEKLLSRRWPVADGHLQIVLLEDKVATRERTIDELEEQLRSLHREHEASAAERTELQAALVEQSATAHAEAATLRAQLADVTTHGRHSSGDAADTSAAVVGDVDDLEAQLAAAEQGLERAAAEKAQLLEAYEALEEDVGGRIDAALAGQAARTAEALAQSEVRSCLRLCASRAPCLQRYVRHGRRRCQQPTN